MYDPDKVVCEDLDDKTHLKNICFSFLQKEANGTFKVKKSK